ncbi:hypothetical protein B0H66DRAFT_377057 [Apodospora peruviana]|uniref:Uncharacterized protein n=1 Tax=Apodospora peruviana TaxID=516989 RepID=A0AAE0HWX8_9PEZI|nr:hypothetical protein B0H66DRAFT_377057 [Apodospora peruviana]
MRYTSIIVLAGLACLVQSATITPSSPQEGVALLPRSPCYTAITTGRVKCHAGPSEDDKVVSTLGLNAWFNPECKILNGQKVEDTRVWYYLETSKKCWVSNNYVTRGCEASVQRICRQMTV